MQKLTGMVLLPGNPDDDSVRRAIYLVKQKIRWGADPVSLSIYHIRNKNESGLLSMQYLSIDIEDESYISEEILRRILDKIDYFMHGYFSDSKNYETQEKK